MATLKKMVAAAVACAAIGLAAPAYAQAAGAAAGSATSAGTPSSSVTGSTTGRVSGMNPTTNNNTLGTNNNARASMGLAGNNGLTGPAGTASQSAADALNNLTANIGVHPGTTGTNLASNSPAIAGGSLNANAGTGANSLFPGLSLGNTSTTQRSLSQSAMARVNARENQITSQLNRASAGTAQASLPSNTTTE